MSNKENVYDYIRTLKKATIIYRKRRFLSKNWKEKTKTGNSEEIIAFLQRIKSKPKNLCWVQIKSAE